MRPRGRSGAGIEDLTARARETAWRPRPPADWAELPGTAGMRYTASELARGLGLERHTVVSWIERGWLRAARQRDGTYRIRHRAVRRALRDHPQVAAAAMRAYERSRAAPRAPAEAGSPPAAHEPPAEQDLEADSRRTDQRGASPPARCGPPAGRPGSSG